MALKKTFEIQIDGITTAVTNVKALREAQEATEKAFQEADFGTAEYARLGKQLQGLETELEKVKISTDALSGADRVEGFVRFGSAITGVVGSASLLGTALGNSSEELEQAEAKLGAFLATMQTFQAIQEAVGKENKFLTSLLSRFGATSGAASEAIGKQTVAQRLLNLVMKANPIGLIITAIGVLIGLFALVANNIDTLKAKFAPAFEFIEGLVNNVVGKVRDLASLLSGGLIDDAATAKTKANAEKVVAAFDLIRKKGEREIALDEAIGESDEQLFRRREILILKDIQTYNIRRAAKIKLTQDELEAEQDLILKLQTLRLADRKRIADEAEEARKEAEKLAKEAAEAAKKAAEERARREKEDLDALLKREREAYEERKREEELYQEAKNELAEFDRNRDKTDTELEIELQQRRLQAQIDATKREEELAKASAEKIKEIRQSVVAEGTELITQLLANAVERGQEQLEAIQEQIALTDQQIEESTDRTNDLEDQLANSRGQRREYLIAQIEKEAERGRVLEDQKKAQAKEEQKRIDQINKKKREAAIFQKVIDIGQAISKTALAIITALGPPPTGLGPIAGIPFSIAAGLTGALQVATIAAQRFALGGRVKRGYELDGFPAYGDNTLALVRPGEVVLNESQQARMGGPAALRKAGVPGFADGGLARASLTPPPPLNLDFAAINGSALGQTDNRDEFRKLGDRIEAMRIVVQPQQVVNEANRMTEIQNRGTI